MCGQLVNLNAGAVVRVTWRLTKITKNYRRYDAVDAPAGTILGSIYTPLTDTATEFTMETYALDGQVVGR